MRHAKPKSWMRKLTVAFGAGVALANLGCVSLAPAPATPEEIPSLQQRALAEPGNGNIHLRLGAALLAAGRCDEAMAAAERGLALLPNDPVGPLVMGQCLEEAQRFEEALALYSDFIEANRDAPGVAAVEGRRVIALRRQAEVVARSAIESERNLEPPDPETVGVLPFLVDGDSTYYPLRIGLANMLTTDLALIRRIPLVERVQVGALLSELRLPPELVDPATAARTGRLLGAGRMILGTVSIPSEQDMRLSSNIVLGAGEIEEPFSTSGNLQNLLNLEKELALRTAEGLGYELSESEVQRIRENVPGNLAAFLSFSRGLMAEDMGDFEAAAAHFAEAVRADPEYQEAQQRLRGAVGAEVVSAAGGGEVISVASQVDQSLGEATGTRQDVTGGPSADILATTLDSSIIDVASHQAERATEHVGSNTTTEVVIDQPPLPPLLRAFILITIVIPR